MNTEDIDWERVGHVVHLFLWPGSVETIHKGTGPNQGDCYKCVRLGDAIVRALRVIEVEDAKDG